MVSVQHLMAMKLWIWRKMKIFIYLFNGPNSLHHMQRGSAALC